MRIYLHRENDVKAQKESRKKLIEKSKSSVGVQERNVVPTHHKWRAY